jgi:hypothetical protein
MNRRGLRQLIRLQQFEYLEGMHSTCLTSSRMAFPQQTFRSDRAASQKAVAHLDEFTRHFAKKFMISSSRANASSMLLASSKD